MLRRLPERVGVDDEVSRLASDPARQNSDLRRPFFTTKGLAPVIWLSHGLFLLGGSVPRATRHEGYRNLPSGGGIPLQVVIESKADKFLMLQVAAL